MQDVRYFLFLPLVLTFNSITAQVLEDLEAPSMPAASIIGIQINEISRPKSLKALETGIFNSFLNDVNGLTIPDNYALEFNPYMLGPRTNFDYLEYLEDPIWQNSVRNLSLSIASTSSFIVNDSLKSDALGFGLRTTIISGRPNEELAQSYRKTDSLYKSLKGLESSVRAIISHYLKRTSEKKELNLDSLRAVIVNSNSIRKEKEKVKLVHDVFDQIPNTTSKNNLTAVFADLFKSTYSSKRLMEFKSILEKVKKERYGWRWEIDAAMALNFPTNNFGYSISPKYGVWTNLAYRPFSKKKGTSFKVPRNFEFIGLIRWININDDFITNFNLSDSTRFESGNVFDFGFRSVFELGKLSVELEYIYRSNQNKVFETENGQETSETVNDDTFKFIISLNYNLSKNIVLSYSIGKNYEIINSSRGNLINGFSLNFGLGGMKLEDLL